MQPLQINKILSHIFGFLHQKSKAYFIYQSSIRTLLVVEMKVKWSKNLKDTSKQQYHFRYQGTQSYVERITIEAEDTPAVHLIFIFTQGYSFRDSVVQNVVCCIKHI